MARSYSKQLSTKVRLPKANPLGHAKTPRGFVQPPGISKRKSYSKSTENADPMAFGNIGFGDTGRTGET